MVSAACNALRTRSVSLRSDRSFNHLARLAGGSASTASRSTAAGAPYFFAALIAAVLPLAVSSLKPIMVS